MIEEIISEIRKLNFNLEEDFFLLVTNSVKFKESLSPDFAGLFIKDNKPFLLLPTVIDSLTMSIAIHEIGHLYDYYKNLEVVESEETALLFEFTYLKSTNNIELLKSRINSIETSSDTLKKENIKRLKLFI